MQIGQAAHDKTGQVGDLMPRSAGDRGRQGADRGGLVHHGQDTAVPTEFVEQFPQPSLGVRQRCIVQPLARWVQRDRVVAALADVQAQEHAVFVAHVNQAIVGPSEVDAFGATSKVFRAPL